MNKITLTFADLNLNAQAPSLSRAEIINHACDTVMHFFFTDEDEMECLFDVADAVVDMAAQTVTIKTSAYPTH